MFIRKVQVMEAVRNKVKADLDFFNTPSYDALIDSKTQEAEALLAMRLGKAEEQLGDPTQYSQLELILLSAYVSYELLLREVTKAGTGDSAGNKAGGALKRTRADVVEVEYATGQGSGSMALQAEQLLPAYKRRLCDLAHTLNITLPLCDDYTKEATLPSFRVYRTKL